MSVLYVFSGLPGSGKSTLAKALVQANDAVYLRIDTIEQALRDVCGRPVTEDEGYRLAHRVAADNLGLGRPVVADSCNPIELTRRDWEKVATEQRVPFVNIEVVCSDEEEHRTRVESRASEVAGLVLPSWAEVVAREYHAWDRDVLRIDTAGRTIDDSIATLLERLEALGRG